MKLNLPVCQGNILAFEELVSLMKRQHTCGTFDEGLRRVADQPVLANPRNATDVDVEIAVP